MSTEPTRAPRSRVVQGDYRITRSGGAIKIEVLDYHAEPLVITDEVLEVLKELGIPIGDADRDH